jgi:hypothetical protein
LAKVGELLESLLEKYLSNDIDKGVYNTQKEKYEGRKIDLEEKYKAIKQ